jgi:PHD/YefM family antitoxin component YafN of YafNO toxin-antitoxin module
MISVQDIRSLTEFQRHTKAHLKRLKASGRPTVLTVNGKAELIVQDAAAFEEMLDAIRGIQRGLEAMKEGTGKPFRVALDKIRAKQRSPRHRR